MEASTAVEALGALAQQSRLRVFRTLIRTGPQGMAAGEIARRLSVPVNTMSSHLAILKRAKLVKSRKQGRSIIYATNIEGVRSLLAFLIEDCCRGQPDVCGPLIADALVECCEGDAR